MKMSKTGVVNYFEDFRLGQKISHATPRTLGEGERALYTALYGSRFAVQSSDAFARAIGYPASPLDDLLVFNTVFGLTGSGNFTASRTSSHPFFEPGTEPFTKMRPRSASVRTTSRFC